MRGNALREETFEEHRRLSVGPGRRYAAPLGHEELDLELVKVI